MITDDIAQFGRGCTARGCVGHVAVVALDVLFGCICARVFLNHFVQRNSSLIAISRDNFKHLVVAILVAPKFSWVCGMVAQRDDLIQAISLILTSAVFGGPQKFRLCSCSSVALDAPNVGGGNGGGCTGRDSASLGRSRSGGGLMGLGRGACG